jgi:hypothetical protein
MQAQQILTYILYGLGALIASAILALLYNFVAIGVLNLPTYLAALLLIIRKGLEMVSDQIGRLRRFCLEFLADKATGRLGAGDFLGPLIYLFFFVVFVVGDLYVAIITIPLLLGATPPSNLNPELIVYASALLYVLMFVAIAAVAADVAGLTHFGQPYRNLGGRPQLKRGLEIATLSVLALLVIFAAYVGWFRGGLTSANSVQSDPLLSALFFLLLIIASLATGLLLPWEFAAFVVLLTVVILLLSGILQFAMNFGAFLLDKIAMLLLFIYAALAELGRAIWNWLSRITNRKVGAVPAYNPRRSAEELVDDWFGHRPGPQVS